MRHSSPGTSGTPAPNAPRAALALPPALTLGLALVAFSPRVQQNAVLTQSFWAAAVGLLVWQVVLWLRPPREPATPALTTVLRPQHYLQAMVHTTVFLVWGYYWRPVYDMAWLLVAQLAFAYAFDMLLAWSQGRTYALGFGPFPIIFSTNLFLWFRDDWFYLQFVMIAVGFMGKAFVRWQRDGTTRHIFNPSAFSLGLFSLVLIATGTTDLTFGQDIATTLTLVPRIYLLLFIIGLVVMYFFSVTLVSGSAAIALFALSALYGSVTGVPYFIDSQIPTAVFLGLHLLVTDPSTSPNTPLGKTLFGALYGVGVFGLYALLGALGIPTFYDKLLCVPLLNLSVQRIDRVVRVIQERTAWQRWTLGWAPSRINLTAMTAWIVFFGAMTAAGSTDGRHPGDTLPFWEEACAEGRYQACDRLIQLESSYCRDNSGWACNSLGGRYRTGTTVEADPERALTYFAQACEVRFQAGCINLLHLDGFRQADPRVLDLRLLLREAGRNLLEMPEPELYARACDHNWSFACDRNAPTP